MPLSNFWLAGRLWFLTWLTLTLGIFIAGLFMHSSDAAFILVAVGLCSCIGSLPALPALGIALSCMEKRRFESRQKMMLLVAVQLFICLVYGLSWGWVDGFQYLDLKTVLPTTAILFSCNVLATLCSLRPLQNRFANSNISWQNEALIEPHEVLYSSLCNEEIYKPLLLTHQNHYMQNNPETYIVETEPSSVSNKILIKGLLTGALILLLLIPTFFIINLVEEREKRQKEVVEEVSARWAKAQTITGPYFLIPYTEVSVNDKKKPIEVVKNIALLPDNLQTSANLSVEERPRSIYKVLLYRSDLQTSGNFAITLPDEIKRENLHVSQARLCLGISDFKGIEGPVSIRFNNKDYDLLAGLPSHEIDETGLSAAVPLTPADLTGKLPFALQIKLKGSQQFNFAPLGGNSRFTIHSAWPNPSFDGNSLPTERTVSKKGFDASWSFSKATLPFATVLKDVAFEKDSFVFGVSMLQPADQYAKTMRSVKYAILFIGLTFSFFFIIELLQKKALHPLQYILVGLALVIFYSLLLSISEYILFDYAYLIAALATVSLITAYVQSQFKKISIALLFGGVLTGLYVFIFVLISLEDTALLVGSIGLFLMLALVMYLSQKINWYSSTSITDNSHPAFD